MPAKSLADPAETLRPLIERLAELLVSRGELVATAESCTGGGVAAALTSLAGSSRWFERGFVTYSNESKQDLLGVAAETLERHGAVSAAVVGEMALGAVSHSRAQWSLAVSGIAGPDGGTPDKPVGTVWFAWAGPDGAARSERVAFTGDRKAVRDQATRHAIEGLLAAIDNCI